MDARASNAWENPFSGGASGEALEVPLGGGEPEREEKVFVAVPEPYKNGKPVLAPARRGRRGTCSRRRHRGGGGGARPRAGADDPDEYV
jgi:hypothetical protein